MATNDDQAQSTKDNDNGLFNQTANCQLQQPATDPFALWPQYHFWDTEVSSQMPRCHDKAKQYAKNDSGGIHAYRVVLMC